jgi:hypothetical protein
MGDDCIMPCKSVTFFHRCISCGGFLHVPCGETDANDCTTCKRCLRLKHPTFGNKYPRKTVLNFLTTQSTSQVEAEAALQVATSQGASSATLQVASTFAENI